MESCDLETAKLEQLDLNAPLLSTRRLCGVIAGGDNTASRTLEVAIVASSEKACRSVPFLWEAAPGVPKEADGGRGREQEFEPPRPPPGRWRPPGEDGGGDGDNGHGRRGGPDDSGDEGDVDSGSGLGGSSDSADVVSLSDSLSVACSLSRADGKLDLVDVEEGGKLVRTPPLGFMMQRFLPAAEAVAASFASNGPRKLPRRAPPSRRHHHHHHQPRKNTIRPAKAGLQLGFAQQSKARSYSSSKACGITVFFPWGFKQAFCGFKSSVRSRASFDRRSHGTSRAAHDGDPRHSFRSEADADGGSGEVRRARIWDSPGWGLRFLDCHGCEGVAVATRGSGKGAVKTPWSLPPIRSPSEPWLAQALRTINKAT